MTLTFNAQEQSQGFTSSRCEWRRWSLC